LTIFASSKPFNSLFASLKPFNSLFFIFKTLQKFLFKAFKFKIYVKKVQCLMNSKILNISLMIYLTCFRRPINNFPVSQLRNMIKLPPRYKTAILSYYLNNICHDFLILMLMATYRLVPSQDSDACMQA